MSPKVPTSVRRTDGRLTPIKCPRHGGGRVMAETDGSRLYLESCTVTRTVTLHCLEPACEGRVKWYPKPVRPSL